MCEDEGLYWVEGVSKFDPVLYLDGKEDSTWSFHQLDKMIKWKQTKANGNKGVTYYSCNKMVSQPKNVSCDIFIFVRD